MPTCKFSLRLMLLVLKELIETIGEHFKKRFYPLAVISFILITPSFDG